MLYWLFLALVHAALVEDDIVVSSDVVVLPLEIGLELVNAPGSDVIKVERGSSGIYVPIETFDLQLTVYNPTDEPIMVDLDDTPLEATLLDGMMPSNYISKNSDAIWAGVDSEFVETGAEPGDHIKLICQRLDPGSTLTAMITLGGEKNPIVFTKANGNAKISFDVEMKGCNENGEFSGAQVDVTTNAIEVVLEGEEGVANSNPTMVNGKFDWRQWPNRGYVETDSDGVFNWVSTWDDPGRSWTHPSQPRTYTFAPDSGCSASLTHNGVTKTLEGWIDQLEADKHQFCASAMYHMQQRTDVFYEQYSFFFGDFTEEGFEDLKGKVARLCSADGYEYNCNGERTCNTGIYYRHCWSIKKSKWPMECRAGEFEGNELEAIDIIKEQEIIDLPQHAGETVESLRQDMLTCSLDERNCKEGSVPRNAGGVVAYVNYFEDREGGKRTINLCPYMFWMGFRRFWCNIDEIQNQYDPGHVYAWDPPNQCFNSPSSVIFHELGHFADICDGDHGEGLTSTVALSYFMTGMAQKPSPPPSPAPTDDPNATPKPYVDPYTPRKNCGDGSSCSRYGSFIRSNPSYWCGFFGSEGTYCKTYGLTMYCCLDMCGECNVNPPTISPSAAPTNDMKKKGGLMTSWTTPEWMEITWDNFPVTSANTQNASLLQMLQFKAFNSPALFVFSTVGLFAVVYHVTGAVRKLFASDPYMEV